jgi:acyl carrier protein
MADELRSHMRRLLPEPMMPSRYVRLDRLPTTASGKVDRAALPAAERAPADAAGVYVAPQGGVEVQVARTWSEILGVERIGADTSFFDLGGHSLLATQVVARLSAAFGVDVPLRVMFERPTVRGVAEAVEELRTRAYEAV